MYRNKMLAGLLAAFLAFAGLACETEDFDNDALEDDPGVEEDVNGFDDADDDLDDDFEDDFDDDDDL